jgi:hypothetical protein
MLPYTDKINQSSKLAEHPKKLGNKLPQLNQNRNLMSEQQNKQPRNKPLAKPTCSNKDNKPQGTTFSRTNKDLASNN